MSSGENPWDSHFTPYSKMSSRKRNTNDLKKEAITMLEIKMGDFLQSQHGGGRLF